MIRNILWLLFCFISTTAWADVEFLRVTCIPETRYFEVEYKSVPDHAVFIGADYEKEGKQRLKAWKKSGYYDPGKFRYECKLPDSTYLITSRQAPGSEQGMCGASPRITLNLSRNGEKWLDNIVFGSDCFGGPSVIRISIRDGQEGWDTRNADLCIAPSTDSQEYCEYLSETYSGISTVMPLTQDELEQYVEANLTEPHNKPQAEATVLSMKLPLTKFKQEICGFSNFQIPPNAVIYAAGGNGYECKSLGYQIDQSGIIARRADVIVNEPSRPVVLLLGAHEPTIWNIEWTEGTRILAVLASGSYGDAVSGIPKSTPVLLGWNYSKNKGVRACIPFSVASPTANDYVRNKNREEINKLSKDVFGRPADYIVHFDKSGKIHIGNPLQTGSKTITSPDIPPDSFFNPEAPLAGEAGLIDAVKKGLLRKGTEQDVKAWQKGKSLINKNAHDKSECWVLRNAYVVLKPFKFPRGLYGADSAVFYVPKGIPIPEGERAHSTICDFNSMRCTGPMCNR